VRLDGRVQELDPPPDGWGAAIESLDELANSYIKGLVVSPIQSRDGPPARSPAPSSLHVLPCPITNVPSGSANSGAARDPRVRRVADRPGGEWAAQAVAFGLLAGMERRSLEQMYGRVTGVTTSS
jgi:hypothetical protein